MPVNKTTRRLIKLNLFRLICNVAQSMTITIYVGFTSYTYIHIKLFCPTE